MKKGQLIYIILFVLFISFIGISYLIDYENGQKVGIAFSDVFFEMLKILPCAFILIGLFEVWVKQETVIKFILKRKLFLLQKKQVLLRKNSHQEEILLRGLEQ